jgi:hypothetical protein
MKTHIPKGMAFDRNHWGNSRRKYSKISNFEKVKLLDYCIRDLGVTETHEDLAAKGGNTLLPSEKTIRNNCREFPYVFVRGAYPYPQSYRRALVLLTRGEPADFIRKRIETQKSRSLGAMPGNRIRLNKRSPSHCWDDAHVLLEQERALREYARFNMDELSCMVIFSYSIQTLPTIYRQNGHEKFKNLDSNIRRMQIGMGVKWIVP